MTTLCLDFGNTRLKYAVFENGVLKMESALADDPLGRLRLVIEKYSPQKSILSSVVDHDPSIDNLLAATTRFHLLSHLTKLPFTTPVGKPETIGADRLALVAAAVNNFPGKNILAIGLGTCITYNFVNKYREFVGGGISPGMDMRFRAMQAFTAKLPLVKASWNFPLVGYDTETNMLSGVILGMAKEIDGFVDAYAEKYGNFNVLLTGGDSAYFVQHLKKQIFADPNLIFKGLYAISECNN